MSLSTTSLLLFATALLVTAPSAQEGRRSAAPNPLLAALDTNGDGALSAEELANATVALKSLDRDGNGKLDANELGRDRGRRQATPQPAGARRRGTAMSPQKPTIASDAVEKKALDALAKLDGERRGNMNVPVDDGRLLRLLTETVGAETVVEIGTSNGYSGIWICLGLRKTGGKLITHEIDPRRAKLARENFMAAGVTDLVTIVEGDAHEAVNELKGPIDVVFIDADKPGYLDYLEKLTPLVRPGGLILAHNMTRPAPDPKFIEAITNDPALETLFFNMNQSGIAVTLKKR